jgi:hypothetical protein
MRRDGVPHQRRHGDGNVTFAVISDELAGAHVAVVDDVVVAVPVAGIPNAFAKLSNNEEHLIKISQLLVSAAR